MRLCMNCNRQMTESRLCKDCMTWDAYSEAYNEVKEDFQDDVEEEEE